MDLDTRVATFGVYEVQGKEAKLEYWADFDHWPADGTVLMPGLADGRYHPGETTKKQLPVTVEQRALLYQIAALVDHGADGGNEFKPAGAERFGRSAM